MRHPLLVLATLLAVLLVSTPARASEPTDPTAHYVGQNLWFLTDWDGSNAFANIMVHAREWRDAAWINNAVIDAEGWPMHDASTIIFGKDNQLGAYKLIAEGQIGNITMRTTPGSVTNIVYNAVTNTTTADVTITDTTTGGLTLTNTRRTAGSALNTGFRNLRLYRPGHATDGSELFDQRFLALMAPFQVIRFMDWVDANKNGEVSWSNRWRPGMAARPNYSFQGQSDLTYGIPLEYMIALSNQLGADMWLNIPVWADDDYITKTAQALKYGTDGTNPYTSPQANPVFPPLNPNLKLYVEYANEVWNSAGGFRCFPWVLGIADSIIANPAPHPTKLKLDDNGNSTGTYDEVDRYTIQARYTAYRSVQISDIFRTVHGDAAMNTTIRVALMGQLGGNYFNPRQLPWLDAFYNRTRPGTDPFPNPTARPVNHYFYAAGGSAYYGVNTWSADPNVFFAPTNYPETEWLGKLAADAIRAKNEGLKRIAYEGGQGLDMFNRSGYPAATNAQKLAINADPRMKTMVEAYHDAWTANGGDLLVYYVNTSALDWEFTPNVWNLDTPKLNAARAIINDRPRVPVTLGQEIPGVLNAAQQRAIFADIRGGTFNTTASTGEALVGGLSAGESIGMAVNTRNRGLYRIQLRAAAAIGTTPNFEIHVNGVPTGTVSLVGAGNTSLRDSTTLEIIIPDEFNVIRVTTLSGSCNLYSLTFDYLGPVISTTPTLPTAYQGGAYSTTFSGSGGLAPYTWTIAPGSTLPAGLTLNASTGVLSGTPTTAGPASFSLILSDAATGTFTKAFSLEIIGPPVITTAPALPNGQLGATYSQSLAVTNVLNPVAWSITAGALPAGLSLDSATGLISGVPSASGPFNFTATVADARSPAQSASLAFSLNIGAGPLAILHYPFDEGTGTAIADTSSAGNDHSTTFANAAWTAAGKNGSALGANAANTGIGTGGVIPTNQTDLLLNPRADAFTLSAWVKIAPGTAVGYRTLFDKTSASPTNRQLRVWTNNNYSTLSVWVGENGTATLNLPATLADGTWHLLTLVNYNDNGTWRFRLYHNDGTTFVQGTSGSTAPNSEPLRLGATNTGFNTWFGNLDDFRIYSSALNPVEVAALYAGTLTPAPVTYTLTYTAGLNGTLSGTSPQTITSGASGTAVSAVPADGYIFSQWSDGSTANPRTDTNVTANRTVNAEFTLAPTPYETWLASAPAYAGLTPEQLAPTADPFGTGVKNLLVYALALDPQAPALPPAEVANVSGTSRLALTFTPDVVTGLTYTIEASSDLSNWSEVTDITNSLTPGQPFTFTDSADLGTATKRFLRLRVTQ